MRIGGIGGPAIGSVSRRANTQRHEPEETETRALIAIAAAAPSERAMLLTRHPAAPFLAQLIATRMQAPQTRARRRAEPLDAIAVYRTCTSAPPRTAGRKAELIA
jgi:hypothetical protein